MRASATFADIMDLIAYRAKYGPTNPVRQYDRGPAMVSHLIAMANGAQNARLTDFMPYGVDDASIDKAGINGVKIVCCDTLGETVVEREVGSQDGRWMGTKMCQKGSFLQTLTVRNRPPVPPTPWPSLCSTCG
mgnify:CR=1 FL=1